MKKRMPRTERTALFESAAAIVPGNLRGYTRVYHYAGEHAASEKLPEDFLNRIDLHACDHRAALILDRLFARYGTEQLKTFFDRQLGSVYGRLVLKQRLLIELARLLQSFVVLTKFQGWRSETHPIDFFPQDFSCELFRLIANDTELVPEILQIPAWYLRRLKLKASIKKVAYAAYFLVYPFSLLFRLRWKPCRQPRRAYKYGFHFFNSGVHHATPPYSLEFLNHKHADHPEDILLVAEDPISPSGLAKIDAGPFDRCCLADVLDDIHLLTGFRQLFWTLVSMQLQFLKQLPSSGIAWLCGAKLLKNTIAWKLFFEKYSVAEFITSQEPGNIFRSLMQKKHNARTTFIFLNSSYDTLQKQDPDTLMDSVFGCMVFDRMLSSRVSNDYFRRNHNMIDCYTDIGVLPADYAYETKTDRSKSDAIIEELGIPQGMTIVSFFDVSMGREHIFTFSEALKMISDIHRLIESNENFFCLYKSRTFGHYKDEPDMVRRFEEFMQHDRVLLVNDIRPDWTSTHYMGVSDLVIGCFASSVGLEAVAGGIPAIFYTPDRLHQYASVLNQIPHFRACGYEELQELTDYWVHDCDGSKFKAFQEKYVKPLIDAHCDGRAHERLERALAITASGGLSEFDGKSH